MSQGNKNKIAIVGHTKGIGKAISDLYKSKGYEIVGMSRSNGYDLINDQEKIMDQMHDCGLVVVNAHAGRGQLNLLKRIYGRHAFDKMKVAIITSTSGTEQGQDTNAFESWNKFDYVQYCEIKKELMAYILELQEELISKPLSVYDVCPDVVDTDMTEGLWEDLPKLKASEVAEAVRYCFESTFNVNKIVIQKNAR
ncbi:MAG: SDR family oxidoreductase [Candidatus Nitrosopelagicus sp.]|jgi:NAD(P)-dependent dehydrogenase (short-subunit alcohol dehydrogenase family)|nr:MAG: SDR family oxidoreductase [Candidatus Nitrosopelagicus sp.]